MQKLDEKKSVMTEIDCNDLCFSDNQEENFTFDIDIASLENSLEISEFNTETFNDKIVHLLSDEEHYSQKRGNIDLDSPTCGRLDALQDESFETEWRDFIPSLHSSTLPLDSSSWSTGRKSHSTVFLKREPTIETACGLSGKIDSYASNAVSRNIFLPYEKSPTSGAEKSFSSPDNLQPKCTARNQNFVFQEYPNRKDKNIFLQKNCDSRIQNEENQKYPEIMPTVSRFEVFVIQENSISTTGPEMIISSNVINSSQKNISNEKNTSCENITLDSERIIFLNEEDIDSQKMIISSQSSEGQRMIISSQETDSQRMITSSQESEKMIISSQEFSENQKMVISSEDSLDDQRMVISSQIFDSENLLISNQVPEDQKVIPTSPETSVRHKMFDTRSGSFPKISKKINLKTESKNYQITGSRLSLKDKKLHKLLYSKRLSGVMTTQEVSPPASIGKKCGNVKESKIISIGELKVRKKFKLLGINKIKL